MNVFIAGPRAISFLDENIRSRLSNIIKNNLGILVGDAAGIDKTVQEFFFLQNYRNITVFASNGKARNNIGNWDVYSVETNSYTRGFDFYAAKDLAMARNADYGLMLWNGESKGTLNNIINLVSFGKKTALYFYPTSEFFTVNTIDDVNNIINKCPNTTKKLFNTLLNKHRLSSTSDKLFEIAAHDLPFEVLELVKHPEDRSAMQESLVL